MLSALAACALATPTMAQLSYTTLQFDSDTFGTITGIRGNTITGNYAIPNSGGATGGLLYLFSTGLYQPFPAATSSGVNFPNAVSATPYGPSFGSVDGILRVVGSYQTAASAPNDLGFLYDGAATPGAQLTTLLYPNPPGDTTAFTIAHSTFGNLVVGNYDTRLVTGNAFIYNIDTGGYTTNNFPGAPSTTAYGIWGNRIAGGYTDVNLAGVAHGYIYNESTRTFKTYDAPGAVVTHFEGITSGGLANTYNLVADSTDVLGNVSAWAVHVDAAGNATWTLIAVPGASVTSANSVYGNQVIGVYVMNGETLPYIVTVPGLYTPLTNSVSLSVSAANTPAITGGGNDLVNSGTISTSGTNSAGISSSDYAVVTNSGSVAVTGAGSAAVLMTGSFGTLLNAGTITAAPGAYAIGTDATSAGTMVVNTGTINGQVAISAGADARFENSGWLGISGPGAGTTHMISGTFVQTAAGTLAMRLGQNGSADKLVVTGVAKLGGTLALSYAPSALSYGANAYQILTASNGVTGSFAAVTGAPPAWLAQTIAYKPNEVDVVLTVPANNSAVLESPGNSIVTTGFGSTDLVFLHLDNNQTGQNTESVETELAAASPRNVAFSGNLGQLAQAVSHMPDTITKYGGWVRGIGNFLSVHGQGSAPAYGANSGGFLAGIDREVGQNLILGVAGGYSQSFLSESDSSSGRINTPQIMGYASYAPAPRVSIDAVMGFAYDRISTARSVAPLGVNATESHDGYEESLAAQAGYDMQASGGWILVPRVGFNYLHLDQTSSTETGAANLDLAAPATHIDSFQPVVSLATFKAFVTDRGMRVVPEFKLAYSRELLSTAPSLTLTSQSGGPVPSAGVSPAHNTLTLGPAITAQLDQRVAVYADYKLALGLGKSVDNIVFAGARWNF